MGRVVHVIAVGLRRMRSIWRKAGVEAVLLEEEWRYRRGLNSELLKMEEARKTIEGLKGEMARLLECSPWAAETAADLLQERLAAVRKQSRLLQPQRVEAVSEDQFA